MSVSLGVVGQLSPHEMSTRQLFAETVQASPLALQTPADALSVVEAVQLQVPQTGQVAGETVQASSLALQTPAEASSSVRAVQLQVPQATGQLFASTVQSRDGAGQALPPHSGDVIKLLDCVPALDASAVEGVHTQALQSPITQSRAGRVPTAL